MAYNDYIAVKLVTAIRPIFFSPKFHSMPVEEVEQYQRDSVIDEEERHSDSVEWCQTLQADDDGSSLDSDGDGNTMQKEVEELYSSENSSDSASHTPAQKSKRWLRTRDEDGQCRRGMASWFSWLVSAHYCS